jgi:hypothetical protein
MSHFTVLVIGNNPESQLMPYQENNMGDCPQEYMEFNDKTDELEKGWQEDECDEFYCNSSSSAGLELPADIYNLISQSEVGARIHYVVNKGLGFSQYFKKDCYYRSYKNWKDNRDELVWIKVIQIIKTDHPDQDVCFTGEVMIEKVNPPKRYKVQEKYSSFDEYIKGYHGYDEKDELTGKYGYWVEDGTAFSN